jgi:hypothetical protein
MNNQSTESITVSFSGTFVLDGKVLAPFFQSLRDSTSDQAERPAPRAGRKGWPAAGRD